MHARDLTVRGRQEYTALVMATVRHRVISGTGALCTVGLLLSLLAFSGHRHDAGPSHTCGACARCVAIHFSPATPALAPPQVVPPVATVRHPALDLAPLASRCHPRPSNRAPPSRCAFRAV